MELPAQVGVMTLPNAVLFPHVLMPLHICQRRDRLMLAAALQTHRMFVVALRRPTRRGGPHAVATVGLITTCMDRPDGTADLILRGVARVRLTETVATRPYLVKRFVPLSSCGSEDSRAALVAVLKKLSQARARLGDRVPRELWESLLAVNNADQLSDLASYLLLEHEQDKQIMLETLDVAHRVARLTAIVQQQIQRLELWRKLQGGQSRSDVGRN